MPSSHKIPFVRLFASLALASLPSSLDGMRCDYYNETLCHSNSEGRGCNGTEDCKPGENDKGNLCYVLWQNNSGGPSIKLKGCWVGNYHDCSEKTRCIETRKEPRMQLLFCCCEGDLCNNRMYYDPPPTTSLPDSDLEPSTSMVSIHAARSQQVANIMTYTLLPFLVLSVAVALFYYLYRRHKLAYFNEVPTSEPSPLPPPSPPRMGLRPIQLVEVKAQGRFGAVWKARMINEHVAVKIFPPQDKNSWQVEQEVFRLPQMNHANVLMFLGAERRGEGLQAEYWLITSYHEKGSLCDYLKANLVNWGEVLSIGDSIARGLMHLHEEMSANKLEAYKPAIAHRDFKSKNVLIKRNMTACIADFGLSLVFYRGQSAGEAHGQVGTRRYMAPEVLEGAINFNRDSFLRIDMYACGLVLWELISRCSAQEGPVEEYMLPFEEEVGQHPTLEDMQDVVAQKKMRPRLKDMWKKHSGLAALCDTTEECWDHDAEARLSASCVQERTALLYKTCPPSSIASFVSETTKGKYPKTALQAVYHPKESSI